MLQKVIPYIILLQICLWLFHAGMGIENWRHFWVYDSQTLFILTLSIGTLAVYLRLKNLNPWDKSFKIIFEHAILIGMIMWFFYHPWWQDWEWFILIFTSANIAILLLILIFESQFHTLYGAWNWWIPDFFWKLGWFLTLINTVTIPLIFILLNQSLSTLWVFFGINWVFLWKEEL